MEFAAQLLQLVHGRVDAELRARGTLAALADLRRGGYVDPDDADGLADSYRFLRRVEHVLQLDDERQTHSVPVDRGRRRRIARVLGFRGTPAAGPTEAFDRELAAHRGRVRTVHERVWFRPLLDSLSGAGPLGEVATAERLEAFGFADVERTRQAVAELTRGLTRSSRMMQQLLPLLLDWLSASPDPDLGLLGLRRLASGEQRSTALATAFRDSPEVARHLALLLGTSRQLGDVLLANPDLIERLPDPSRLRTPPRRTLVASGLQRDLAGGTASTTASERSSGGSSGTSSGWRRATCSATPASRRSASTSRASPRRPSTSACSPWTPRCRSPSSPSAASGGRSSATPATSTSPSCTTAPTPPRPSGWRAACCGSSGATPPPSASGRSTPTSAPRVAAVRWRAASRGGTATSQRWASTWERQAYLRVRSVAGDPDLGQVLVDRIQAAVWERPLTAAEEREVRRMKVRIEQERIAPGEDPDFHLKLGHGSLSDIEFTVQLLQLRHGCPVRRRSAPSGRWWRPATSGPRRRRCWRRPTASARALGTAASWWSVRATPFPTRPGAGHAVGPVVGLHRPRAPRRVPAGDAPRPARGGATLLRSGVTGYAP